MAANANDVARSKNNAGRLTDVDEHDVDGEMFISMMLVSKKMIEMGKINKSYISHKNAPIL